MENSISGGKILEGGGKITDLNFIERIIVRWFREIKVGTLIVGFPSGIRVQFEGENKGPVAELDINDLKFAMKVLFHGDLGFAESFVNGQCHSPDLPSLLRLGALNEDPSRDLFKTLWGAKFFSRIGHAKRANTRNGSKRNICQHYDLGNEFYRLWLNDTMTYSSAIFRAFDETTAMAQRRKYLRLAKNIGLKPGDTLLEIGCGWGDFAEMAALEFGCKVTAITLSAEQAKFAKDRFSAVGLTEKIDIQIADYRDLRDSFDKVVSIEMFEAVGEDYWSTYFDVLRRCLKPGGRAGLQVITINDDYFEGYKNNPDFIQKYIFPGGMLPSRERFEKVVSDANLKISDSFFFGKSYAETLRRWHKDFLVYWPQIKKLGFDERFHRMWQYYLSYCEVGFDNGQIDVGQFVIHEK